MSNNQWKQAIVLVETFRGARSWRVACQLSIAFHYLRRLMENGKKAHRKVVMSGIRSTGFLHLGNYFGAIRNYVRMQEEYECYFMVADLHSLTTHPDTRELKENVHRVLAEYIACGVDPDKASLYCQSHLQETAELYLLLNMLAYKGELEKTTTFK